jgi:nucleotide-binding universal stress UspA family protein
MRCVGDIRTGFGLLKWQVDCEAWLSEGDPKLVICKEAKEKHPDLLVLGSRGLGTIQR